MRKGFHQDEDDDDDEEDEISLNQVKRTSSLYDESVEVVGADDIQSPPSSAGVQGLKGLASTSNKVANVKERFNEQMKKSSWESKKTDGIIELSDNSENSDEDEEDEDDDDDDVRAPIIHGAYDPTEYEELAVSEDIKEIFSYITKYTPQSMELENKLYPFLPDFIPAVGDIDAFIKIPRPDGKKDGLGLNVLDEPCTHQSDPAVLQLQLRAVAKQSSSKAVVVKKIENAEKNGKAIERWIKAISDLHSSKPLPTVNYTKPMPSIDNLMQEWPPELEEKLNSTAIPSPDLDCDLATYVTIICKAGGASLVQPFDFASENIVSNTLATNHPTLLRVTSVSNSCEVLCVQMTNSGLAIARQNILKRKKKSPKPATLTDKAD